MDDDVFTATGGICVPVAPFAAIWPGEWPPVANHISATPAPRGKIRYDTDWIRELDFVLAPDVERLREEYGS